MTGYRAHLCCAAAILALVALPLAAQTPSKSKPDATPKAKRDWRGEADQLANEVLDNATKMSHNDSLFAYARLCSAYWKADNVRARAWCAVAVDDGSRIPQQESKDERQNRVAIAAALLRTVGPLDAKYQQQLQDSLTASLKDDTSPEAARERRNLAENLAQSAAKSDDPAVKAKTLSESLRLAPSGSAIRAIIKLHETEPPRADELFAQAVQASAGNYESVWLLSQYVLPGASHGQNAEPLVAPDQWHAPVLSVMAGLTPESVAAEQQSRLCGIIAPEWERNLARFSTEQRAAVQASIDECRHPSPKTAQQPQEPWPDTRGFQSSEEFLRAISGVRSPSIRYQLRLNAMRLAESNEHDAVKALAIADAANKEELEAGGMGFYRQREELAKRAALDLYLKGQSEDATKLINASPVETRLAIATSAATQLQAKKSPATKDALARARALLTGDAADPADYFKVANLYEQLQPDQAATVLGEAAAAWQEWKEQEMTPKSLFWFQPLEHTLRLLPIEATFANVEPERLRAIARSVDSLPRRSAFQLTLLQMYLDRSLAEQKPSIKAQSAAAADVSR